MNAQAVLPARRAVERAHWTQPSLAHRMVACQIFRQAELGDIDPLHRGMRRELGAEK